MEDDKLSEPDKYLLLGLLLKKPRSEGLNKKALRVVRSRVSLDQKIDRLLAINQLAEGNQEPEAIPTRAGQAPRPPKPRKRPVILILDHYTDITRLLQKSPLRNSFNFSRVYTDFDEKLLIGRYEPHAVIINQSLLETDRIEITRLALHLKAQVGVIFLCSSGRTLPESLNRSENVRMVSKPINVNELEQAIRELGN